MALLYINCEWQSMALNLEVLVQMFMNMENDPFMDEWQIKQINRHNSWHLSTWFQHFRRRSEGLITKFS